jgi:hypothetical protein
VSEDEADRLEAEYELRIAALEQENAILLEERRHQTEVLKQFCEISGATSYLDPLWWRSAHLHLDLVQALITTYNDLQRAKELVVVLDAIHRNEITRAQWERLLMSLRLTEN